MLLGQQFGSPAAGIGLAMQAQHEHPAASAQHFAKLTWSLRMEVALQPASGDPVSVVLLSAE